MNDCIFRIHRNLAAPLTAQRLAEEAGYSPHHFHRVFKNVTGENIADYIRRARLELAASRLMFEPQKSIIEIAEECGFQSPASFSQAFKKHFLCTPSRWRNGGYDKHVNRIQTQQQSEWLAQTSNYALPAVSIKQLPERRIAYIRHLGYDRSIRQAWQYLRAWCHNNRLDWDSQQMIGLHHSNPDIVPLAECRYVAGITLATAQKSRGNIGVLSIPGGSYAVMQVSGQLGELLPIIHNFYHQWLPTSGYHLLQTPGYALYRKNQFLNEDESFDLDFCVPVSVL